MSADKKNDDLTIVLFYDEDANKFHNEPLSGGGAGAADAVRSRISLKSVCSEETNLGSVSLEDVKYKLQVSKESLPIESEVATASSSLLVTTSGEFVEVDDYNKFKEIVIERCKQKVKDRMQNLPQQQQLEQLGKGLLNGIEELDMKVVQREQHKEAICMNKVQAAEGALDREAKMQERMKRKALKEWKHVSKRILLNRIEKYFK